MDKRWIYILIILIIGVTCLYFIVDASTTLGSANVNVNSYTITLPSTYNVDSSGKEYVDLINRKTNEKIHVEDLGKGNSINTKLSEKLSELHNDGETDKISNTTVKIDNSAIPTVYYENLTNNTDNQIFYMQKHNHTFIIICNNIQDNDTMMNDVNYIIDTLKPDFKQKQD